MKIAILAPGLSSVVRGVERFCLDLAAELRRAGLDATCWGASAAPGVEPLAVPGRVELQNFALNHLRKDPRFAGMQTSALQDWSIYTEDQLFSIPAAMRIREMLDAGERVMVYARWQGGLVDPSGAPTQLLKVMASATAAGTGRLVVHTDYYYAPFDYLLLTAGAVLHSLGPWLTEKLVRLQGSTANLLELPMCVDASRYRGCRESRAEARRAVGIPEDAFMVLSVGAFDSTTPDKRHLHMLREILAMRESRRVWWVVAGSRGALPMAWEEEARRALGERFVPLANTPFEGMPRIYGMADLFALASLDETFGLVYLEAQMAGLPIVAHDTAITRHICSELSPERLGMTLVEMRRPGAAAAAIEQWRQLLIDVNRHAQPALRDQLDDFARLQERRFGWEFVGTRYARAFQEMRPAGDAAVGSAAKAVVSWDEQNHGEALQLFEKGDYREAAALLGKALGARESDERWNDWATIQMALGNPHEAEAGFRRALALAPEHAQAALNLGTVLATQGRFVEAIPLLERGSAGVDARQRAAAARVLDECRARLAGRQPPTPLRRGAEAKDAVVAGQENERPLRILMCHENLPRVDQGGAEFRWMQVLREMRNQGHEVTYLSPRGYQKERYAPALAEMGIEHYVDDTRVLRHEGFDVNSEWTLQQVLREGQFDVALFYLWFWMGVSLPEYYLDEVRRLTPRTRIAVLSDDCHGLREERAAKLSGLWSDRERAADVGKREMEILRQADIALAISDDDRKRFIARAPDLQVDLLSYVAELGPAGPDFDAREGIMFLADYSNPASRDGVEWYLKEVAPIVRRKVPGVQLHLAGVGLTPDIAAGDDNVVRVGFVADLAAEFVKHRILISPVRYGTGIKTKSVHAMAHGVPVVTTPMGAEGMDLQNGKTAMIADSAHGFADAVTRLYTDRNLWKSAAENGRAHIAEQFPSARLAGQLREFLDRAKEIRPRRFDAEHCWSIRAIEARFPEILNHQPVRERPAVKILAFVQAAEKFAAQGDRAAARQQLRHVFSFVPKRVAPDAFFGDMLSIVQRMEKLYRELGEPEAAAEFRREARMFNASAFPAKEPLRKTSPAAASSFAHAKQGRNKRQDGIQISVVIPTFNRRETLADCLDALSHQSLAAREYEVVLVDDGSTDGTADLCRGVSTPFKLQYLRQANCGAGAARRAAVERASGRYLLLFNDDTIAAPDLLGVHLENQRRRAAEKLAVLGDFRLPTAAAERALTHYLSSHPLLFPQITLEPGVHSKNAFFIASNMSVRRGAVVVAGSFDPRFRVAEDTELGVRLRQRGYSVLYVPEAKATHQHLAFTIGDLVRRAQAYGQTQLQLLRKHPQLLGEGTGPFGRLEEADIEKIRADVARRDREVNDAREALERFDSVDFMPFHARKTGERTAAEEVMTLFDAAVPAVFWFYLFESFLQAWDGEQWAQSVNENREKQFQHA